METTQYDRKEFIEGELHEVEQEIRDIKDGIKTLNSYLRSAVEYKEFLQEELLEL